MWYRYAQKTNILDIPIPDILNEILSQIKQQGGTGYLVGGIVRDSLFNKIHKTKYLPKDYDVEVFRLPYEKLVNILSQFGKVSEVGKSFGVIKLNAGGEDYDFSLPRTESKSGEKHQDFNINSNPNLSEKEAAARRDVTINSILFDPLDDTLIDNYRGIEDIKNKVLKHTSSAFAEDPLRVLRLMSLGSRFGLNLDPSTAQLAQSIKDEYKHLPKERVYEEFKKLTQKGIEPGRALEYLYKTGWSENFPHIHNLQNVKQEEEWHPEIWLDEHTKQVMNEAAKIATEQNLTPEEREILVYAALCHDFAKPATTKVLVKKGIPRITSHGHEEAGGPLAREFLTQIGAPKHIIDKVVPLVENHLNHIHLLHAQNKESFIKNLAERLHPATIEELHRLIDSDHKGRRTPEQINMGKSIKNSEEALEMSNLAKKHNVHKGRHPDFLQGRDLISFGLRPSKEFGDILKEHRKLILDHKMTNKEEAHEWLDKRVRPHLMLINGNDVMNFTPYKGAKIKEILEQAWNKQKNKEINNRDEAISWLQSL
jgi:tRNA nucleotidyltransferase (CCA-adding enzyme)